jgi:hypothetical protein
MRKSSTYANNRNNAIASLLCGIKYSDALVVLEFLCTGRHDYWVNSREVRIFEMKTKLEICYSSIKTLMHAKMFLDSRNLS